MQLLKEIDIKDFIKGEKEVNKMKDQIQEYANKFLADTYNLPSIRIKFHLRKDNTLGYYCWVPTNKRFNEYISLNTSILLFAYFVSKENMYAVLRHELTHYALHHLGKNFDDGNETFEKELKKNHAISSSATSKDNRVANIISDTMIFKDVYEGSFDDGHKHIFTLKHSKRNYDGCNLLLDDGCILYDIKRIKVRIY